MSHDVYRGDQRADDAKVVLPGGKVPDGDSNHVVREILQTAILTVLVFFVVHIGVQFYNVQGPSMQPGLHTGEYVLVNKLAYDFGAPHRGDVIVFNPPTNSNEPFIKRVIGLPGDTIKVTPTAVYVDNSKLNEPYTYPLVPGEPENTSVGTYTLKANEYWVMGDHRQNSTDSRVFGPVLKQSIIGKAEAVVWPQSNWELIPDHSHTFAGIG